MRADAGELDDGGAAAEMAKSPTVTWPASMTLLEKMTLLPTRQSCPTWLLARKAQLSPITVCMPPPSVPGFMRDALADHAVAADLERRGLALVFQVLRLVADRGEREDARPGADGRAAGDDHMAQQLDAVAERDLAADHAEGADAHALAEPGAILDDGGRRGRHILASSGSRIMALTSASATTWPFTFASP